MSEIFALILDMGAVSAVVIAVILLLRAVCPRLRGRAGRAIWIAVGIRLLIPVTFAEYFKRLFPKSGVEVITHANEVVRRTVPITRIRSAVLAVPQSAVSQSVVPQQQAVRTVVADAVTEAAFNPRTLIPMLWLIGIALIVGFAVYRLIKLSRKLSEATIYEKNIYRTEAASTPFIYGLVHPKIYVPYAISDEEIPYALMHERQHIKKNDHIAKLIGFIITAIYWFNPLVYAAYAMFCRDIELACDERVISDMEKSERRRYSSALLSCSTAGQSGASGACHVAFAEVGVKERIVRIMKYTKPTKISRFITIVLSAVLMAALIILPMGCANSEANDNGTEAEVATTEATATTETAAEVSVNSNMEEASEDTLISQNSENSDATSDSDQIAAYKFDDGRVLKEYENDFGHYMQLYETNGTVADIHSDDGIGIERLVNSDGSISMFGKFESDILCDTLMLFNVNDSNCTEVKAKCTEGTLLKFTEDDIIYGYDNPPCNDEIYDGNFLCWTYQNTSYAGSCCGDAAIEVEVYGEEDNLLYTGTINISALGSDNYHMKLYTFSSEDFAMEINEYGDIVLTHIG